jgi:endonuclease G
MFGFLKKGFGRGGNTLMLLVFFFALGLCVHFKEKFFSNGRLEETIDVLLNGSVSEKLGALSDLSRSQSAQMIPFPVSGASIDEVLTRREFVYPVSLGRDKLQLVEHTGFSLGYNERYEQAAWVAYPLVKEQVTGPGARERFFNPDPKVKTGSSVFSDYTRSGYDRGHLAPAADFKHSLEQMKETFYMSNISPQDRDFNAGVWNELEQLVRAWAYRYEKVFTVTGPVLKPGLPTIGKVNQVAVPEQFYKVVLYAEPPHVKGIAFLLENQPSKTPLSKFVISIDSLESVTGLDFFPMLPESISEVVESKSNPKDWYRLK